VRARALGELVVRDLRRSARSFVVAAVGIAVGIATLAFFLALGAGMREVVLGRIFPIDRLEVVPAGETAGALVGEDVPLADGVTPAAVDTLRRAPGVRAVYPKMRLLFPSSGRGGRAILGRDIGTGELVADGIDPDLVAGDLSAGVLFDDPLSRASGTACRADTDCGETEFCDVTLAASGAPQYPGACAPPVPALVSPYLVEVFNGAIAPAHRLPPLGDLLLRSAEGLVLEWDLGRAGLGSAAQGQARRVHVRIAGVSPRAIELGFTVPLAVARRLNLEYAGEEVAARYTSAVVLLRHPADTADVAARVRSMGLEVKTSGAEQMGLLVAIITAVLSLTSVIVVVLAALNIAHAFSSLIAERRGEIGLMRALGARRGDVRALVIGQAAVLGLLASSAGLLLAWGAAWAWNRVAATRLPAFPFKPEDWFVFEATTSGAVLLFGVAACVLSALAPAARAARTEPAAALAGGV
jgi:hypothetical protein